MLGENVSLPNVILAHMKPVIAVKVAVREVEAHHHLATGFQTLNALRCANAGRGLRFHRLLRVGCFTVKTYGQHRIRIWSKRVAGGGDGIGARGMILMMQVLPLI